MVFGVLAEEAAYYHCDYDESHHADHYEPDKGAGVGISHGVGAGAEVSGELKCECLCDKKGGNDRFDHISSNNFYVEILKIKCIKFTLILLEN